MANDRSSLRKDADIQNMHKNFQKIVIVNQDEMKINKILPHG